MDLPSVFLLVSFGIVVAVVFVAVVVVAVVFVLRVVVLRVVVLRVVAFCIAVIGVGAILMLLALPHLLASPGLLRGSVV